MLQFSNALTVSGPTPPAVPDPLPVSSKQQCMSNWCWAAVAELVSSLLDKPPLSQCEIATASLNNLPCCPCPDANHACNHNCNATHNIEDVFGPRCGEITKSPTFPPSGAVVDFDTIAQEITRHRPVTCRIQSHDGTWHYVVIIGVATTPNPQIRVCDPLMPDGNYQDIPFDQFSDSYRGGHWDVTVMLT